MPITDIAIARLVHILGLIHWIGGLTFVTLVVLPSIRATDEPGDRISRFHAIEHRFAAQVRLSVLLVGLSGFYLTQQLHAWSRFGDPGFWWMHAMVALWTLFMVVLFVVEPFFGSWILARVGAGNGDRTIDVMLRAHRVLLVLAVITVAGGLLGAHGALY